jgi:acetyl esterase/lipase
VSDLVPVETRCAVEFANVDGRSLLLDLHRPRDSAGPLPAIILVHGGGWRRGDRADHAAGRQIPLAATGLVVASVDYSLSGDATFPAPLLDLRRAVRWLRANAGELGSDPDRVGVLGASSGGHLAALLALAGDAFEDVDGGDSADASVGAVVLLCPVIDAARWDEELAGAPTPAPGTFAASRPSWPLPRLAAALLGVDNASAVPALADSANPLTYVAAGELPPFLILHGDADSLVPLSHSERMHTALRDAGGEATLLIVAGGDHEAEAFETPAAIGAISAFLHSSLGSRTG